MKGRRRGRFRSRSKTFLATRDSPCSRVLYAKQLVLTSFDSVDIAYTTARFAHKYDAPFLLKSANAYQSAHVFNDDQPQVRAAGIPVTASRHAHMFFTFGF